MTLVSSFPAAPLIVLAPLARAEAGQGAIPVSRQAGDRSNVKVIVYPDARHGFDIADPGIIPGGVTVQGHLLEYNEAATRDAAQPVRAFLDRALQD